MNPNIKIALKYFYEWNHKAFWKVMFSVLLGIIIKLKLKEEEFPFELLLIIPWVLSLSFFSKASWSLNGSGFSWKYMLSLPLSKKEFLMSVGIIHLLSAIPLLVCTLFVIPEERIFQFLTIGIPVLFTYGFITVDRRINEERILYFRNKNLKLIKYTFLKVCTIRLTCLFLAFHLYDILDKKFNFPEFGKPLSKVLEYLFTTSWIFFPLLFLGVYLLFQKSLNRWKDEKVFFPRLDWKAQRDIPILAVCFSILGAYGWNIGDAKPYVFAESPLLTAVYEKDYKGLDNIISSKGADLSKPNQYGYNAFMVAAQRGDLKMYKYLTSKIAARNGIVKISSSPLNGMDLLLLAIESKNESLVLHILQEGPSSVFDYSKLGYQPIHAASKQCMTRSVDLMIEKGVDPKVLGRDGGSTLHYAAMGNCFATSVSLLDHGVDPTLSDKSQKVATAYFVAGNQRNELTYLYDKRSRNPAGK
ncbi:MAG TPA: ankyrin repeat domain-containing protein [Bacteriovoracaceae bacterium]|nr:ankyrin repeat domain-containing protein [Bacteriovoracaceae bacterium]